MANYFGPDGTGAGNDTGPAMDDPRDAEIARLRAQLAELEGDDDHPENRCERCRGRNITWYADSDMWNKYAGDASVLCPLCFAKAVEEAGGETIWRLAPGDKSEEATRLLVRLHETMEQLAASESKRKVLATECKGFRYLFRVTEDAKTMSDVQAAFEQVRLATAATDAACALEDPR